MSTFNEGNIRRGQPSNAGQFRSKETSAPRVTLGAPSGGAGAARPLNVQVLDRPDPAGGFDLSVETPTGTRYFRDGKLHRADGPAYVGSDGTLEFRREGALDRSDGPAFVDAGGYEEHWVNGKIAA